MAPRNSRRGGQFIMVVAGSLVFLLALIIQHSQGQVARPGSGGGGGGETASKSPFDAIMAKMNFVENLVTDLLRKIQNLEQNEEQALEARTRRIEETVAKRIDSLEKRIDQLRLEKGDPGEQGSKGEKGVRGEGGTKGDGGPTGRRGTPGLHGIRGAKGMTGQAGPAGPKGEKGQSGDSGDVLPVENDDCYPSYTGVFRARGNSTVRRRCEEGWLVIQSRHYPYTTTFNKTWAEYRDGFGSPFDEHWFGLRRVRDLMERRGVYELKLELYHWMTGIRRETIYGRFRVGNEAEDFYLDVANPIGDARDLLRCGANHNGMRFTTWDHDRDNWRTGCHSGCNGGQRGSMCHANCANCHGGGWWYNWCHSTNLNGDWRDGGNGTGDSIEYYNCQKMYTLERTKMLMRRIESAPPPNWRPGGGETGWSPTRFIN